MFKGAMELARRRGEARARAVALRLAEAGAREAPAGVRVEAAGVEVRLAGRGLARRMVTEPALRWLIGRVE